MNSHFSGQALTQGSPPREVSGVNSRVNPTYDAENAIRSHYRNLFGEPSPCLSHGLGTQVLKIHPGHPNHVF